MVLKELLNIIEAKTIYLEDESILSKEYFSAFSTDLMSDALALLKNDTDTTLFITGLANVQSLRTIDMLDLKSIVFVRGKELGDYMVDEAKELGINIFKTELTMFETCGLLYEAGLRR